MKEVAILAGVLVVGYLLLKRGSVSATVTSPGDTLATPTSISGGPLVSGGYQVSSPSTQLATGALTGASLPSYVSPPPVSAPPPPYYGGTGGTVGTGGAGLGGPVVAGVSVGTGSTVTRVVNGYTRTIKIMGIAPGTPPGTPYRAPTSTSGNMIVPTVIA